MSSVPALAIDNSGPQLPEQLRTLRLSDAEKIASDRLDSASISSLKAALAGVTAKAPFQAQPRLVERIDAAAKLAADATAAAEAVESLKRLLQAQLAASRAPAAAEPGPAVPPASGPAPATPMAPAALSSPPAPEQRRPDVHGFLAGFVLSGAIGAVLYLYMMAG
jgi:pilus assembly protein FimV